MKVKTTFTFYVTPRLEGEIRDSAVTISSTRAGVRFGVTEQEAEEFLLRRATESLREAIRDSNIESLGFTTVNPMKHKQHDEY